MRRITCAIKSKKLRKTVSRKLFIWIENYFYKPNLLQICVAILLLPLSFIYFCAVWFKFAFVKPQDLGIKIISVGNLTLGGSGKTPFTKFLFRKFSPKMRTFIILRGYNRQSKGLIKVAIDGKLLANVKTAGDEATEYATTLKNANVIVSESRELAILEAKHLGAELILLDDGFSKFHIKKFNILIENEPRSFFPFVLPSGAYRYPRGFAKFADLLVGEGDITRRTKIKNETEKMVLITAIAKADRLKEFHSKCVGIEIFPDHYDFSEDEVLEIVQKYGATSVLTTQKDYVKMANFGCKFSVIELETELNSAKFAQISKYINKNDDKIANSKEKSCR